MQCLGHFLIILWTTLPKSYVSTYMIFILYTHSIFVFFEGLHNERTPYAVISKKSELIFANYFQCWVWIETPDSSIWEDEYLIV